MKKNRTSGNRTQSVSVKYPWMKDLKEKSKDKERRLRRKKINEIKEAIENLPYREIMVIDHMIKSMVIKSHEYEKDERRN